MKKSTNPTIDPSALGELVDEIHARIDRGEEIDIDQLAVEFPEYKERLRRMLPMLKELNSLDWSMEERQIAGDQLQTAEQKALGDFRILRQIGRGGMGVVYEAQQLTIDRKVAIKILPLAALVDPRSLQRFKIEVTAIATLEHPHIVSVYSVGEERGIHYFAMQLIRGQSLAAVIRELRLRAENEGSVTGALISQVVSDMADETNEHLEKKPVDSNDVEEQTAVDTIARGRSETAVAKITDQAYFRNVVQLALQAADALQHAHENGIVHRDVKPGNLLLDTHGSLFVTDFGLARIEAGTGMTMTGDVLGTLRYMSPEQVLANRVMIDHRTDIYSLGVTLYELLTLQPMWPGGDKAELIRQISFEEPTNPRKLNPAIPEDLETIILKAISKNPNDRYHSAQALAEDLQSHVDHKPIKAKRPTVIQRVSKWTHRNPVIFWSTAVFLLLLTISSAVTTWVVINGKTIAIEQARIENQLRKKAEKKTELARQVVNEMYEKVASNWLLDEPGSEDVQREFLEKAVAFNEELVNDGENSATSKKNLAKTLHSSAVMYSKLGEIKKSKDSLKRAINILKGIPDSEITVKDLADLLLSESNYTVNLVTDGLGAEAIQFATASLDWHAKRRSSSIVNLHDAVYASRVASMLVARGSALTRQREFDSGAEDHLESIRLYREVLGTGFAEPADKRNLAGSLHNLCLVRLQQSDFVSAEKLIREAVTHARNAVADEPRDRDHREILSNNYSLLTEIIRRVHNDPKRAAETARQSTEIISTLARDFGTYKYLTKLANAHSRLAMCEKMAGNETAATESYQKSVEICRQLSTRFAQRTEHFSTYSEAIFGLAGQLVGNEKKEEAELLVKEIHAASEKSSDPKLVDRIAMGSAMYPKTFQSDDPAVIDASKHVVTFRRRAVERFPGIDLFRIRLGGALHNLSTELDAHGRYEESLELVLEAIELQRRVLDRAPEEKLAQIFLRNHYANLCLFLADCPDEKLRDLPTAIQMGIAAKDLGPESTAVNTNLAIAYYRNNEWLNAKTLLLRVVQEDPKDSECCFVMSAACSQLEESKQAEKHFREGNSRLDELNEPGPSVLRWRDEAEQLLVDD